MTPTHNVTADDLQAAIRTACLLEATARKLGNVHPTASFADLTYRDFVVSAQAAAPVLAQVQTLGVGRAIFEAVRATREATPRNTNLGIILLLAPLAAVPPEVRLTDGIGDVLAGLTVGDAEWAYRAIRLAQPGGLGEVRDQDVSQRPTGTLREVMRLAADRDSIAEQYATNFRLVLQAAVDLLAACGDFETGWEQAIIGMQLSLLAERADSLIVRKCGIELARDASRQAQAIIDAGWPDAVDARRLAVEFDAWLRADGNRRNPGTTADLIAAALFAALRDGNIQAPQINVALNGR